MKRLHNIYAAFTQSSHRGYVSNAGFKQIYVVPGDQLKPCRSFIILLHDVTCALFFSEQKLSKWDGLNAAKIGLAGTVSIC
jgi:hypothetical protein